MEGSSAEATPGRSGKLFHASELRIRARRAEHFRFLPSDAFVVAESLSRAKQLLTECGLASKDWRVAMWRQNPGAQAALSSPGVVVWCNSDDDGMWFVGEHVDDVMKRLGYV